MRAIEISRELLKKESERLAKLEKIYFDSNRNKSQSPRRFRSRSRSPEPEIRRERNRNLSPAIEYVNNRDERNSRREDSRKQSYDERHSRHDDSRGRSSDTRHPRRENFQARSNDGRRNSENLPRENFRNSCRVVDVSDTRRIVNRLAARSLPNFDGDPTRWMFFKRAYDLSSELGGYSDLENVARLHDALTGNAKESVESLMISDCTSKDVMDLLTMRFGNPDVICERIARDLKRLPNIDSPGMDLVAFATKLKGGISAMRALNHIGYLYSPDLARDILLKIPTALKYDFNKFVGEANSDEPRLVVMANFLYEQAELSCRAGTNDTRNYKPKNNARGICAAVAHEAQVAIRDNNSKNAIRLCGYCAKPSHQTQGCRAFAGLSTQERWIWARSAGHCYACLAENHIARNCTDKRRCAIGGCTGFHHPMLHSRDTFKQDRSLTAKSFEQGNAKGNKGRNSQSQRRIPLKRRTPAGEESRQNAQNGSVS